mgnify:CR=1 FL=1
MNSESRSFGLYLYRILSHILCYTSVIPLFHGIPKTFQYILNGPSHHHI